MRRPLSYIFSLLLVSMLAAGCGDAAATQSAVPAKPGDPAQLSLATGGTAGTYYFLGDALTQLWNSKAGKDLNITAQSTGASVENLNLLNKGATALGISQSDMMNYAFNGTEMFKNKQLTDLRAVAYLYPEFIQIVARADSDINSVADLKGKTVGVGAPGSGTEATFRQIAGVFGLTYQDLTPQYLSFAECADKFKDKQIDAFLVVAGFPNNAIMDVAIQNDVKVLNINNDMLDKINKEYPFLSAASIPGGTYKGQNTPVNTVAVMATLVVNAKLPEFTVYTITKTLFENLEELGNIHAKGKEIKMDVAVKSMSIPFHAGAEKYFREKGALK